MISNHTLPPDLLRRMSGPGDRAEIEFLQAGQVSRRLVQLRTILDEVHHTAPEAGTISGLSHSFATLAAAQRENPPEIADLLSGPQVGAWAAHCLRHLAGAASPTPLWVHLAHLGAIAATAALRTGIPFEVQVPVRSGVVSLPTLGSARLPHTEPWSLVACTPGNPVHLNGSPPPEWRPIRLLETDTHSIPLDNTDPYWTCFDLPVNPTITDATIERWQQQLAGAMTILAHRHQHRLAAVSTALRCLVPLEQGGPDGVNASSREAPGAVALTEPVSPDRFAATLVHEIQHFRLYALNDLVPLHREARELLYSPWRNDPRGLSGLLHGTVAFLGVADYWSREWPTAGRGAELMYARTVRQLHAGCRILQRSPELTPAGRTVVATVTEAVGRLPRDGIFDDAHRLAADIVAHHRAVWRLRNVSPEPADVAALAKKLQRGEPIGAVPDAVDHPTASAPAGGDSPLFRLAMAWVADRERVTADATDPDRFARRHRGVSVADLHLIAGDYRAALTIRLAGIADDPLDPDAWAALSVAVSRLYEGPGPAALTARPELVRAAWSRIAERAGNPPVELLSRYIAGTSTSDSMRR